MALKFKIQINQNYLECLFLLMTFLGGVCDRDLDLDLEREYERDRERDLKIIMIHDIKRNKSH